MNNLFKPRNVLECEIFKYFELFIDIKYLYHSQKY